MDAIHYDRIADKLIQFHSKLPQNADLECKYARIKVHELKKSIGRILTEIEIVAHDDAKGWIR